MAEKHNVSRAEADHEQYRAPKLTVFGNAIHLTAAGTQAGMEGGGTGNAQRKP